MSAHAKVAHALRAGHLTRAAACEECGRRGQRLVAHHDDYAKPLEVRWICDKCHSAWHAEHGSGANQTEVFVTLRMPRELHDAVAALARKDLRTTPNQILWMLEQEAAA